MTRRPLAVAVVVAIAVTSALLLLTSRPPTEGHGTPVGGPGPGGADGEPQTPIPIPIPGHEVYGYVPYWEMDDEIAAHVAVTDLTTLGAVLRHAQAERLAGDGRARLSADRRPDRSSAGRPPRTSAERAWSWSIRRSGPARTPPSSRRRGPGPDDRRTVRLAADLGLDGVNVDVECSAPEHVSAYGEFVGRLRTALRARNAERPRCRSPRRPTSEGWRWRSRHRRTPASTGSS